MIESVTKPPVVETPEPGVHENVSFADYRAWQAVSQTGMKILEEESASSFREMRDFPRDSKAFREGRLVDCYSLEPEQWPDKYTLAPTAKDGTVLAKRSKADKATWAQYEERGKELVKPAELELAKAMRAAFMAHSIAGPMVTDSKKQVSLLWQDAETGILCKARPDMVVETHRLVMEWAQPLPYRCLADLKTTRPGHAHPRRFYRTLAEWGYQFQAAFYRDGWEVLTGEKLPFLFVVGEKRPYPLVAVHGVTDRAFMVGRIQYRNALRIYQQCVLSGEWPGYDELLYEVDVPEWLARRELGEEA